jgi:hypothetical protein
MRNNLSKIAKTRFLARNTPPGLHENVSYRVTRNIQYQLCICIAEARRGGS